MNKEEPLSLSESGSFFQKQTRILENRVCFDCNAKNPQWASIPFGIYICVDCASNHRTIGTHITFVRSITIDTWKPSQLRLMKSGGNLAARIYFSEHGIINEKTDQKYSSNTAINYRKLLESKAMKLGNEFDTKQQQQQQQQQQQHNSSTNTPIQLPINENKVNSSPLTISSSPLLVDVSINNNSNQSTPKQEPKSSIMVSEDSEWDDFDKKVTITTNRNNKKPVAAKSTTKRISKQSFDDDWDSIPEVSSKSSTTKSNESNIKQSPNQSPEFKSTKYSSKFDMEDTVEEPLHNKKKNNQINKSRESGNDFEFYDSRSGQSLKVKTNESNYEKNYNNNSNTNNSDNDYARKNFSNAKSISSQQYFGEDKDTRYDAEKQARLSKFQGATSISSAQYYDRDESTKVSDMRPGDIADKLIYLARTDLRSVTNAVIDGSKKLTNMATNYYQDMQDRYR